MTKQRVLLYALCGAVVMTSATSLAQGVPPPPEEQQAQPVPEPPVVYIPQQQEYVYMPSQQGGRAPRQRRYREPYFDGMQIPPGGEIIQRRKLGLMIPGLAIFGVSYISMVSAYAISNDLGNDPPPAMLVPVLGPFLAMGRYENSTSRVGLGFLGTMQVIGVTMFAVGVVPRRYVQYFAGTGDSPSWALMPVAGAGELGAQLGVRF